jgi:protein-S-isoprenylcysteine O-methyltransferase Ste14
MERMKESIIKYAAKYRTAVSRFVALILVGVLLISDHSFGQESVYDLLFELSGIFLISLCVFGRLWSSVYISGYKKQTLITEGPYSIVRHPLYLFSLIGTIGVGLLTKNVLILGVLFLLFVAYYPFVILAEEGKLLKAHGEEYVRYMKRVPRFIPKLSLLDEPPSFNVKTIAYRKTFFDTIWFIWLYIPLEVIERLHNMGILPVFFRVP